MGSSCNSVLVGTTLTSIARMFRVCFEGMRVWYRVNEGGEVSFIAVTNFGSLILNMFAIVSHPRFHSVTMIVS